MPGETQTKRRTKMKTIEKTYKAGFTTLNLESYIATIKQTLTIADDGKKELKTDVVIRNEKTGEETHDAEISLRVFKHVCEVYTIDHLLKDINTPKSTLIEIVKHDGAWTVARVHRNGKDYEINVMHFELPSQYGIRRGRISKLWIAEKNENGNKCVCFYDRGWSTRATTKEAKAIRDELVKMYN